MAEREKERKMVEMQRAKDERERQAVEADVNRHFELSIELARKKMGAGSSWPGQMTKEEEYQAREQLARHQQYARAPPPAHGAPPQAHSAHGTSAKSTSGSHVDPRIDPRYAQYPPKSSLPSPRADPKLDHRVIPGALAGFRADQQYGGSRVQAPSPGSYHRGPSPHHAHMNPAKSLSPHGSHHSPTEHYPAYPGPGQ